MARTAFLVRYIGLAAISLLLAWLMSTQQVWSIALRKIIPIFWAYGLTAAVLFLLSVLSNFFVPLPAPSPGGHAVTGNALARELMQWAALRQEIGTDR